MQAQPDQKLLSIAIPTYNRASFLDGCLKSIVPQTTKHGVPIYIFDNGPTDETKEVATTFMKSYPNIYYFSNPGNVDDRHVDKIRNIIDSRYVWVIGDKIRIAGGAMDIIIKDLESGMYDLLIVNSAGSCKRISSDKNRPEVYSEPNTLLSDLGWWTSLMGSTIWDLRIFKEGRFEKYAGTQFLHFGVIFDYISDRKFMAYCEMKPLIYSVKLPVGWIGGWLSNPFEIFAVKWSNVVNLLPSIYTEEAKKKCIKDLPTKNGLFSWWGLLWLRQQGHFSYLEYKKYKSYFPQTSNLPVSIILLISILPRPLATIFVNILKLLKLTADNIRGLLKKK